MGFDNTFLMFFELYLQSSGMLYCCGHLTFDQFQVLGLIDNFFQCFICCRYKQPARNICQWVLFIHGWHESHQQCGQKRSLKKILRMLLYGARIIGWTSILLNLKTWISASKKMKRNKVCFIISMITSHGKTTSMTWAFIFKKNYRWIFVWGLLYKEVIGSFLIQGDQFRGKQKTQWNGILSNITQYQSCFMDPIYDVPVKIVTSKLPFRSERLW